MIRFCKKSERSPHHIIAFFDHAQSVLRYLRMLVKRQRQLTIERATNSTHVFAARVNRELTASIDIAAAHPVSVFKDDPALMLMGAPQGHALQRGAEACPVESGRGARARGGDDILGLTLCCTISRSVVMFCMICSCLVANCC